MGMMKDSRDCFCDVEPRIFKHAITQINFYITDAYENCDKGKREERKRSERRLLARRQKFTCPRCFRIRRLQIRCVALSSSLLVSSNRL